MYHGCRSLVFLLVAFVCLSRPPLASAVDPLYPDDTKLIPGSSGFLVEVHTANKSVTDGTVAWIVGYLAFFKPAFHQFYWTLGSHGVVDKNPDEWTSYYYSMPDSWRSQLHDVPYFGMKNNGSGVPPDDGWLWDTLVISQFEHGQFVNRWTWHNDNMFIFPHHPWYPLGQGDPIFP